MEYRNLQQNIYQEEFNDRAQGILNWIKENREKEEWAKDPNAFEMTNVFLLGAKYAQEGSDIDKNILQQMWDIRSKDFVNCGISENSFVYQICKDSYQASQDGRALVNDEASHHALRSMADIGLYLGRQKFKGEDIKFNNAGQLLELIEASRTLKGVHQDLFERYGFEKNLQTLVRLQPENALSSRIEKSMQEVFSEPVLESHSSNVESVKEKE